MVWAQLCGDRLPVLLEMIRLKSSGTLSHFDSWTARQVYMSQLKTSAYVQRTSLAGRHSVLEGIVDVAMKRLISGC